MDSPCRRNRGGDSDGVTANGIGGRPCMLEDAIPGNDFWPLLGIGGNVDPGSK